MRYFISLILSAFLILSACKSSTSKPAGLIPEKKMKAVLWDMMRADQFLTDFVFSRDSSLNKLNESLQVYNQIFTIHKISKEAFRESFRYYQQEPGLLKALLDSVSTFNNTPTVQPVPDTVKPAPEPPRQSRPDSTGNKRKLRME